MGFERLSAQDSVFLHVESEAQPMHVGSLGYFEAGPFFDQHGRFRLEAARQRIASRLHLVPRFRKKIMLVPLDQGRPVWIDDPTFDLSYHVRLTALPTPGTEEQLKTLMARLQAQLLDRRRPLWEIWFVEGVEGDRIGLIQKTHHCLVDGISGVDVATVLLDIEADVTETEPQTWEPEPAPTPAELFFQSLKERATEPAEMIRSARAALRVPRNVLDRAATVGRAIMQQTSRAPRAPWNVPIGPHRRWENARVPLAQVRRIKDAAKVSVNDVVLAACTGALRRFLEHRQFPFDDELVLRAMVPVSVRSDDERGALGNRVSMIMAELPVGVDDPVERLEHVHEHMREMKESGVAVGADTLVQMTNYLPPTVLSLASRVVVRAPTINLGITNVPGPQFPLYCMGSRMLEAFPFVGILNNQALIFAVLSYDGQLGFGITGDRDVMPDLGDIAQFLTDAFDELERAVSPLIEPTAPTQPAAPTGP